jgi:NAD(P)H-hydrate epimerase
LLETSTASILENPIQAAQDLASRLNAITVLKGATTVIAHPDEPHEVAISTSGHSGMASGGSGDVLAGLLGAWLCGAEKPYERTAAGVYLHGKAGELAAERYGNGLIASDLVENFSTAWRSLT